MSQLSKCTQFDQVKEVQLTLNALSTKVLRNCRSSVASRLGSVGTDMCSTIGTGVNAILTAIHAIRYAAAAVAP